MNRFSNFLKKRKLRKTVDSIITLNGENEDIIEDLGIITEDNLQSPLVEIPEDNLQSPLVEEPKIMTKKVSINITLNLNVKESDSEKLISILNSYF